MNKLTNKVKIHTTIRKESNDKLRSMAEGYGDIGRILSDAIDLYYEKEVREGRVFNVNK